MIIVLHFFQLMRKNPEKRLGAGENDAVDVKQQRFFKVIALLFFFVNCFYCIVEASFPLLCCTRSGKVAKVF